jgi:hypothetical protein
MNRKPVIDYSLVAEGLVFDDHGLRCRYLGKTSSEKPQYLKQIAGRWRSIEDVQREAAQPAAPVESEVNVVAVSSGPNGSHDVRKDGDGEDGVALVDALSGDCSPPCEPTLSTPVNANVPNGSMKAELQLPGKAAMSETEGPKTETTALGAMGCKRGRGGGRKKQKLPAETSKARQKRHECMRVVLDKLSECPALSDAAKKAGVHRKTLENWRKRSEAGADGYDIEWQGVLWRFHKHVESAIDEALGELEVAAFEIAKGGVVYKYDEALLSLGFEGPDAYARDQNGNPIPEVIFKARARGKMIRFLLELWYPDKYGNHPKIDIPQQGGIVFVDVPFGPRPSGPDAQRSGRHDHSALTIAALRHVEVEPGLLHRVQLAVLSQGLDRGDILGADGTDGHLARARGDAVDMHSAGTAQGDPATVFGARESYRVAQYPEQGRIGLDIDIVGLSIDRRAVMLVLPI